MKWIKTLSGYVNLEQVQAFVITGGLNELYIDCVDRRYKVKSFDSHSEAEQYLERLLQRINRKTEGATE